MVEPTAKPTLLKREGADFIGYTESAGTYYTFLCPDRQQIFTTSGSYWACASSGATNVIATACVLSTIYFLEDNYLICNQGYTCNTGYMFSSPGAQNPLSEYGCFDGGTTLYYRTVPASTVATPTTDSLANSSSQTASSSATNTASNNNSGSQPSKIWISGAVIGPVVGIAILAALIFWIWRLRKKLSASRVIQPPTGPEYVLGPSTDGPKNPSTSVMSGSGLSPPELESTHSRHFSAAEVPSNWVHQTSELPNNRPFIAEVRGRDSKVELAG